MKKSSRLALLISSSLLFCILPYQQSMECIDYPDWEQSRARFFDPGLGLDDPAGLSPFYFTEHSIYTSDNDPRGDDVQRNCREWQAYLGREVHVEDIREVLYGQHTPDDILSAFVTDSLTAVFPRNTFIYKVLQSKFRPALNYLILSKRIERSQTMYDPWRETTLETPPETADWEHLPFVLRDSVSQGRSLCAETLAGIRTAPDAFLAKRYAYQTIVCQRYYGGRAADSIGLATFDRYFSMQDTTILLPWVLIHKAEFLSARGDSLQANYLLTKVFDGCVSKRRRAAELYVSKWTEKTLAYAPTPADKALVLTMQAIQYPGRGLSLLQRIAAFDPNCRYLPLLIAREINKLEHWTLTNPLSGYDTRAVPEEFYAVLYAENAPENAQEVFDRQTASWQKQNAQTDRASLHDMRLWVEKMRLTIPSAQTGFLGLAAAHLNFLEDRYKAAQGFLDALSPQASPRLQAQRTVEEILLSPYLHDLRTAAAQNDLVRLLDRFWQLHSFVDRPSLQLSRLNMYLCRAFFQAGDRPLAGLFFNKAWLNSSNGGDGGLGTNADQSIRFFNAHATYADLERLIVLAKHGPDTPLEKYLLAPVPHAEPEEFNLYNVQWWYTAPYSEQPDELEVEHTALPALPLLLELQGTIAFRDGDLPRAKASLEQLPPGAEGDPVPVGIFGDAQHFPFEKTDTTSGTKMTVVQRLLELEAASKTARGERLAEIYYQLGNGWFNCSYWGRAWSVFSYQHRFDENDAPQMRNAVVFSDLPDDGKYGGVYYRFDRALAWYRRALATHPSKELAARIEYMIADCDRYTRIMHGGTDRYYNRYGKERLPSSPLFRKWAATYGGTGIYAERIAHCPELRDYLGIK